MYSDEDLNTAIKEGIFQADSVSRFRQHMANLKQTAHVDEENFRLITGFNDVFVVVASVLLLVSSAWLTSFVSEFAATVVFAGLAWLLAEFFVRQRRMALPAIVLLIAFLGGVAAAPISLYQQPHVSAFIASGLLTAIAAWAHWMRFQVPITIAAVTAAIFACIFGALFAVYALSSALLLPLMFIAGLITFVMAVYWDSTDKARVTRRSDTAFWLHLLSAPLLVHPVFTSLGITQGSGDLASAGIVLALYVLLAIVSIAVDRRSIMVSALIYVIYAFSGALEQFGMVNYSFAVTGLCIGATLLLLSAFWQPSRAWVIKRMPSPVQHILPIAHS
ncbi:hypothetical protein [Aestuariibacter salexigens]|uniref:hypothetical protein n=1 Tax=Aestuariibacter salexigens TaxID=226010 RepID=UPI0004087140|nr:hypothetical protein [Aestuariibacter salexigens]